MIQPVASTELIKCILIFEDTKGHEDSRKEVNGRQRPTKGSRIF